MACAQALAFFPGAVVHGRLGPACADGVTLLLIRCHGQDPVLRLKFRCGEAGAGGGLPRHPGLRLVKSTFGNPLGAVVLDLGEINSHTRFKNVSRTIH